MKRKIIPYFEIFDGGDLLRVEVHGTKESPSLEHLKEQWLNCTVTVQASTFHGQYTAEIMLSDLKEFRQQLVSLIYDLDTKAVFEDTQGYLYIALHVEADGYTLVEIKACDVPDIGGLLIFKMAMDKSDIEPLANQLETITDQYAK